MWIREVRVAPLMDRFSNSLLSNEADLYSHQFPQTALGAAGVVNNQHDVDAVDF